jgi:hypothetical protein
MRKALLAVMMAAAPAARADDLTPLSDTFDRPAVSEAWSVFHRAYGWADQIKAVGVVDGVLKLEPHHSAWVRDRYAPFLFKTVEGDFDVRARVRVRGAAGPVPGGTWSLGGLMARSPNENIAGAWEPRRENWNFVTTGVGHEPGRTMTETKATYNSNSSLKLRPFEAGWVELRLVRVGMSMFALARSDPSGPWLLRDRWYRMDTPPWGRAATTEVGLIAYTTSVDRPQEREDPTVANTTAAAHLRTDMILEVDWIRFARPRQASTVDWYAQVNGLAPLTNPNLPEADVLSSLGD